MDELDFYIASILDENGRISNREIACQLELSEKTVRNRINRMIKNGNFQISAMFNVEEFPDLTLGIIGAIRTSNYDIEKCMSKLKKCQPYFPW